MSRFERRSGAESSLPARLRAGAGTQLERRVLNAAAREEPSRELCERMAQAIGVAPPSIPPIPSDAPNLGAPPAQVVAGSRAFLTWLSAAGAVVAVVATAVAMHHSSERASTLAQSGATPVHTATAPPPVRPIASSAAVASARAPAPAAEPLQVIAPTRARTSTPAADIQEQIALIDRARAAMAAGASSLALGLLRQYQSKYPAGSFRPEAAALKIEALGKLGRSAEARALAAGFAAEYGGGPLADRVSRLSGQPRP